MFRNLIPLVGWLLLAQPAAAAIIYVYHTGSNTSPYDTPAKAATTLATAVSAWTTSDIIYMDYQHSETTASTITYAAGTANDPVRIVTVDTGASDAYTPRTSAYNVQTTSNGDIIFNGDFRIKGAYFNSHRHFTPGDSDDDSVELEDVTVEITQSYGFFTLSGGLNGPYVVLKNSLVKVNAAADRVFQAEGLLILHDVEIQGALGSGDEIFLCNADCTIITYGLDVSAQSGATSIDLSGCVGEDCRLYVYNGKLPASFSIDPGNFDSAGELVLFHNTDADGAGSELHRYEKYTLYGDVIDDTGTYRNDGWQDVDGDTRLSYKMTPGADVQAHVPLEGPELLAHVDATGSTTFSLYFCETFTTAPTKAELWVELRYLGTTNSTLYSFATSKDELGSTAVDSTSKTWTEGTACTQAQIDLTVTINRTGTYVLVPYLGKYEAGKSCWVDPLVGVS